MPVRVKVSGDLWHGRVPDGAVYVGRAAPGLRRSPFANPHKVQPHGPGTAAEAVARYEADLIAGRLAVTVADVREQLAGRDLACWCPLDAPCHADVLLDLISEPED